MWEICLGAGCLHVHILGRYDLMGSVDIINQPIFSRHSYHRKEHPHSQEADQASCDGQLSKSNRGPPLPFSNVRRGRILKVAGK